MKIIKKLLLLILLLVLWLPNLLIAKQADEYMISSPDSLVEISYYLENGRLHYKLFWEKQLVINSSEISLIPDTEVRILDVQLNSQDTIWNPVWGQFSEIRDHYNELILDIEFEGIKGELIARVFDNGLGFRFKMDNLIEHQEVKLYVEYNLADNDRIFFPVGESEPIGPIAVNEFISDPDKISKIRIPLVVEKSNKKYLSILESDLYSANGSNVMELSFNRNKKRLISANDINTHTSQLITPWRVILLGNSAGELVTNTVTVNLATPNQLENNDWVRPGKTLWDWRVHGFTALDGFKYGINTESYKRFIDFAAKNDVEYFLIDDSWYEDVSKGHFEISEKLNLNEVNKYAAEKGVDLILYYDRKKGQYGDDELFPYYKSLGMKGIKYGFMGGDVDFSREAIKKSAENKLLINFHDGPVPFTGMRRTYPNAVTREYCHAQQDSRRAFTPEAFIKMALVNAIQGPLDMNNGNFDLVNINNGLREKGPRKKHSYFSTVVSEAARTLIIFSGLLCLPDSPEAYTEKKDLFEFIQKQPVGKWDETIILNSKIGEYITTARRYDKEWFIGSVIDQKGGTINIKLDFLKEDYRYEASFYEDTEETHCKTNPESYQVRMAEVKKDQLIQARMAPGGGHCMWIRPIDSESVQTSGKKLSSIPATLDSNTFINKSANIGDGKYVNTKLFSKPNIVLLLVDDLGYSDVGYMQYKEKIKTPNIDKLAKKGMIFTDAYAAAPVCSPTRASVMTGKYPASLQLTCHIPGMGMENYLNKLNKGKKLKEAFFLDHLSVNEITIAEVLKEHGYKTGYIGKWHLAGEGSAYTDNGIVDSTYHPNHRGFDINIGGCAYGQPKSYFSPYKNGTINDGPEGEYLTDRLGDEAVNFIEENKENPFFLNLATYTVHTPLAAPPESVEKYDGNKYFAMIDKLDQNVGKVIDKLEELRLLENTMVIFYSDNGGLWGNYPLKGIKGTLNEGGIRVPLIFSWDKQIQSGTKCEVPVTSVDLFPTITELIGISNSQYSQIEGHSLIPLLKQKGEFPERPIYWHFPHHRKEGLSMGAAIRLEEWKYILEFETEKEYLYNLKEDISENKNMINKYPDKAIELSKMLQNWQKEVGAEMPEINNGN